MSECSGLECCEFICVDKYEIGSELECTECGCDMGYGTPHETCELVVGNWEGDWRVYSTCHACVTIRDDLYEEFIFGKLWERLGEMYGLTKESCSGDGPAVDEDWDPPADFGGNDISCCGDCKVEMKATRLLTDVHVTGFSLARDGNPGIEGYVKDWERTWSCPDCINGHKVDMNNPYDLAAWNDAVEERDGKVKVRKPDMEAINRRLAPKVVLSESMEKDIEELEDDR
jgi:hypothetical protein